MEQKYEALKSFKDWSNYMLIATVGSIGWISDYHCGNSLNIFISSSKYILSLSLLFAILTLSLIPIVMEKIEENTISIYDVDAEFKVFWIFGPEFKTRLKVVCWPQHVLFIIGIVLYVFGSN